MPWNGCACGSLSSDTDADVGTGQREQLEADDPRLVRALQLSPRASFAKLGATFGMHERTAARRYRRLRRAGTLRIFGMVDPMAAGHQFWQVRVRCCPDASESRYGISMSRGGDWRRIENAGRSVTPSGMSQRWCRNWR
ncbi:AsnC family transcriptional regulator [Nocardia sp. NPDC046763]|uniref:AsnC family transcriptional regulator n=1 Tax=Nocardia sp. NPDC046763 TaxID=3155256 RepID=UPI0033ECD7A2